MGFSVKHENIILETRMEMKNVLTLRPSTEASPGFKDPGHLFDMRFEIDSNLLLVSQCLL